MSRVSILIFILAVSAFCLEPTNEEPVDIEVQSEEDVKVGGWQEVNISDYHGLQSKLQNFVKGHFKVMKKGFKIIKMYRQVVAGYKYRLIIEVRDRKMEVILYEDPQGKINLIHFDSYLTPEQL